MLEIVLRFLPVAWAPPVQPPTADNPIQRYVPNTPFNWSLGWNFAIVTHKRTNAQGFVADHDYDAAGTTPLLAIAGDSFVEALLVPFAETLTGRLQAMLADRGRVYAFAQSGAPLSQYVAYAHHAPVRSTGRSAWSSPSSATISTRAFTLIGGATGFFIFIRGRTVVSITS